MYTYFLFSAEQYKLRTEIEKNIGKKYIPGKVIDSGVWKDFTEKSINNYNRYADAKVIHEGELKECEYKEATSEWGGV